LDASEGITALTECFKEYDRAGGGDVEGADAAAHGNAQQVIAGAADEIVETCALAAEDEDAVAGKVELVVVRLTALVETDDPEVLALEFFEGADEIDDAGDAQVLGCAGAGLDCYGAQGGGAALGEQNAIDSCAIGYAQKSAEILRVFNAVEGKKQAGGSGGCGGVEVFEGEEILGADEGHDALVSGGFGECGQLLARLLADADAGVAAEGDEALQALVVALAGDENVVEAAAAGLEGFLDRMQAVQNVHVYSVVAAWLARACKHYLRRRSIMPAG
jgi:hypothetical protein